ncbi:MAG: Asp/Glu racemase [Pseudomonadota bacterium]
MTAPSRGLGRIGVLVPYTNTNLEPDLASLAPMGVSIHATRLGGYDLDAIPDAGQMAGLGRAEIEEPLRLIAGVRPDVILYGCTSATLAHGAAFDRMLREQAAATAGAPVITAAGALLSALAAIGARRIGFASPYVPELNDRAIAFLAAFGVKTVARAEVATPLGNHDQGALTPEEVLALGLRASNRRAEALVLSCTDMRAVEAVERLEAATGLPVVTSNQALMHAALPHLGLSPDVVRCGRLFQTATAA